MNTPNADLYATDAEIAAVGFRIREGTVYGNVGIYQGRRKIMVLGTEQDARYYLKHWLDFVQEQARACTKKR